MENNTMYHHGTKGMRWGIRRYQNKDGSLTPAGRKRYRDGPGGPSSEIPKKSFFKRMKKTVTKPFEEETPEQKKERILASRSAEELYRNAHLFSTSELQTAYNRLQLEANISRLAPAKVDKGKKIVGEVTDWTKKVGDLTSSGISLYNNVAKILNANPNYKGDKLPIIGDNSKKDK